MFSSKSFILDPYRAEEGKGGTELGDNKSHFFTASLNSVDEGGFAPFTVGLYPATINYKTFYKDNKEETFFTSIMYYPFRTRIQIYTLRTLTILFFEIPSVIVMDIYVFIVIGLL